MSNYTTGEMAKLCDVSVRTVQYYDTKGILHPSNLTEGGRRLYSDDDLQKFRLICALKAIGFSLNSIKNILESELSGKILTILLDEQVELLTSEIAERKEQLERITVIKESIHNKSIVPANTILEIEDVMEQKRMVRNKKKLSMIHIGVGVAVISQLLLLAWLIRLQVWWAFVVYILAAFFGIFISTLQLKDTVFICPKCNVVFELSLGRKFFSVGDHKVRWMACPECGDKNWCVLRNKKSGGIEYES